MRKNNHGQALIILIFAIALAITILTGVTISAITLGKNTRLTETSQETFFGLETGAEIALLRLIRDPNSCNSTNDNFSIGNALVNVSYNLNGNLCTINVTSGLGTIQKKLQLQATISGSVVTYCCWKEQP